VVAVKSVAVNVVVVLAMLVTAEANVLEVEDSQRVIVPVWPLKVSVVAFVPAQTVALPVIVPPTEAGETVTVAIALFAELHTLFVITAL
jgi:hypothetical protein